MSRPLFLIPLCAALSVSACGGKSSPASPTGPSSTTTSISVSVNSPIRMGQTAQATGVATLSNGQTQTITAGWRSDAPGVASVTDAGLVSGIANGRATVYVVSGGRQGQQVVRVVPDYQGRWFGSLRVVSCTQTGFFVDAALCDLFAVGTTGTFFLSLAQTGESMTATIDYGEGFLFPPVSAPILENGTSAFASTLAVTEEGITISIGANFNVNSPQVGALTGTGFDLWTLPNIPGEMRVSYALDNMSRTSTSAIVSGSRASLIRRGLSKMGRQAD